MEKIKKTVEQLFNVMGFSDVEVEVKKDNSFKDKESLIINTKTKQEEAEQFFKKDPYALSALQHLLRILIFKQTLNPNFLIIDINNYRKEREDFLINLAKETVEKVRKTKKAITLEPMSAYDRRLIHLKLAEQSDIVTESVGQEPDRRIMVRLYP